MNWEKRLLPWGLVLLALVKVPGLWLEFQSGKWMAFHYLGVLGFGGFLLHETVFPAFGKKASWSLGVLLALTLGHLFYFQPTGFEFALLDRLSFLFIALTAWRGFVSGRLQWEDFWWPLALSLAAVSVYGIYQAASLGFPAELPFGSIGSFGGQANNAAQLAGLALLLWWTLPRKQKHLFWGTSVLAFAFVVVTRGRAALLALLVGAALLLLFKSRKKVPLKSLFAVGGGVGALGLALVIAGHFLPPSAHLPGLAAKPSVLSFRPEIWRQTVKMIAVHPLGVGVDRFPFSFLPFHQGGHTISYTHLAYSPHNEFLRYLAEDGVVLALCFALAWAWVWRSWWRKGAVGKERLLPLAAFFLVEMMFSFPWQNAFPAFVGALALGSMGAQVWKPKRLPDGPAWKGGYSIFVLLLVIVLAKATVSRIWERSGDTFRAKLSCEAVPSNWQACLNYSRHLLTEGQTGSARAVNQKILDEYPLHFPALRHQAAVAKAQRDALEFCFLLWKYDDLFGGGSDVIGIMRPCPYKWMDYFRRKRPERYYGRQANPVEGLPPPPPSWSKQRLPRPATPPTPSPENRRLAPRPQKLELPNLNKGGRFEK